MFCWFSRSTPLTKRTPCLRSTIYLAPQPKHISQAGATAGNLLAVGVFRGYAYLSRHPSFSCLSILSVEILQRRSGSIQYLRYD